VETRTFTGYLLYDVLTFLGPKFDPAVRNDKLRFYASATGSDGYQAIVAWGEFDPTFENKAAGIYAGWEITCRGEGHASWFPVISAAAATYRMSSAFDSSGCSRTPWSSLPLGP